MSCLFIQSVEWICNPKLIGETVKEETEGTVTFSLLNDVFLKF